MIHHRKGSQQPSDGVLQNRSEFGISDGSWQGREEGGVGPARSRELLPALLFNHHPTKVRHEKQQSANKRSPTMTERTVVKQSMVDDDAISLTSTVVSEYGSDQEFSVDKILAEKTEGKKRKYLILWENYPLEKATWEPHKNINDEILEAWKERKSRESKGLDEPFNVAKFGALLARLAAEKADRRRRRKSKRKRLGRTVSPSPSEADDSDSSVEAVEDNEVEEVKPGTKRKSKSPPKKPAKALKPLSGRRESTSSVTSLETARMAPEKKASSMLRQSTENPQSPSRQASEVCFVQISTSSSPNTPQSYIHSNNLTGLQTLTNTITVILRYTSLSEATVAADLS